MAQRARVQGEAAAEVSQLASQRQESPVRWQQARHAAEAEARFATKVLLLVSPLALLQRSVFRLAEC